MTQSKLKLIQGGLTKLKRLQNYSKWIQKTQKYTKIPPKWPPLAPKWLQNGPQGPQIRSKMTSKLVKIDQLGLKMLYIDKVSPICLQFSPKYPKIVPQMDPKWTPKYSKNASKLDSPQKNVFWTKFHWFLLKSSLKKSMIFPWLFDHILIWFNMW